MTKTNVLFIELVTATDGKPFDAFVPGAWKDMLGRPIEFKENELADYFANTKSAIESTRGESGEIVGLPIDAMNHNKGNAAGWIVGVELVGDLIRAIPRWTDLGRDLIQRGLQKFFSATVDVESKTIIGGSLTNWPAMKQGGRNQLRPVELSENLRELVIDDDSQDGEGNMSKKDDKTPEVEPEVSQPAKSVNLAAMREQIKTELLAEFQAKAGDDEAKERLSEAVKLEAFADVADLSQAREEMLGQMQAALLSEYNRMQANAGTMLADMMKQIKRDQHIAEFSQRVTSGTDQNPQGFPVGQEEVEALLGSLDDKQRAGAESIFTRIHEQGLIQFSELGHGKRLQSSMTLPAEHGPALTSWVEDGHSVSEYFAHYANDLGEMSQYNLDEYKEKE